MPESILIERPLVNLKRVIQNEENSEHPVFRQFNEIVIGGMGGSGIVGSIITDIYSKITSKPLVFLRVQELPAWAGKNTLVIIVSYSGNTSEMLSLYADAKQKGCGIVTVTSGGKLAEIVTKEGGNCILTDGGFMPRSDISTPLAKVISVIDSQLGTDVHGEYMECLKKGASYAEELEKPELNAARIIAMRISSRTPFFYAAEQTQCVASRWRAQFNENTKKIAGDGMFPEFDHNELEGWCGDQSKKNVPVFIRTKSDGKTGEYIDACTKVLKNRGIEPYTVFVKGETLLESIVFGTILGDYVSLYSAEYLGVDPSPVDAITEFKNSLK